MTGICLYIKKGRSWPIGPGLKKIALGTGRLPEYLIVPLEMASCVFIYIKIS